MKSIITIDPEYQSDNAGLKIRPKPESEFDTIQSRIGRDKTLSPQVTLAGDSTPGTVMDYRAFSHGDRTFKIFCDLTLDEFRKLQALKRDETNLMLWNTEGGFLGCISSISGQDGNYQIEYECTERIGTLVYPGYEESATPTSDYFYPGASTDDGYIDTEFFVETSQAWVSIGRGYFSDPILERKPWVRFVSVTIPQGATITSALIKVTSDGTYGGSADILLNGNDTDDASAPISDADFNSKAKTTSETLWEISALWSPEDEINTPDISAVIQEIIDRPGWASGNSIMIFFVHDLPVDPLKSSGKGFYSYDNGSKYAELFVEWTE